MDKSVFSGRLFMLKRTLRLVMLPAAAAVLVACGGGSTTASNDGSNPVQETQGLQNPSAFRLSETVSAVPPQ
jgi:hypothetical protein